MDLTIDIVAAVEYQLDFYLMSMVLALPVNHLVRIVAVLYWNYLIINFVIDIDVVVLVLSVVVDRVFGF